MVKEHSMATRGIQDFGDLEQTATKSRQECISIGTITMIVPQKRKGKIN